MRKNTRNPLSYHHSMWSLLKFAAPAIGMMIVISLYTVTDGIFIGRYVGSDALAASNIVYPAFNLVLGLAIMLAAGGSALVAKTLGEGNSELAGRRFTLITASAAVLSLLLAFFLWLFMEPLLSFLGASPALYEDCALFPGSGPDDGLQRPLHRRWAAHAGLFGVIGVGAAECRS